MLRGWYDISPYVAMYICLIAIAGYTQKNHPAFHNEGWTEIKNKTKYVVRSGGFNPQIPMFDSQFAINYLLYPTT